jgi:hypothetical protein
MNDFTKEELRLIHDGLCYASGASLETGGMMKDILMPVAKKIQSLIDNYCEHDLQQYINIKLAAIAQSLPITVDKPASFACGYDTGYKQAMLDLERFLEDE